jgi:hypothetical protein
MILVVLYAPTHLPPRNAGSGICEARRGLGILVPQTTGGINTMHN